MLPGRHAMNASLLAANAGAMGYYLMSPGFDAGMLCSCCFIENVSLCIGMRFDHRLPLHTFGMSSISLHIRLLVEKFGQ